MSIPAVQSLIYELRGHKVMLDSDLASLYGVETKQLKRAVRRNIQRFAGDDFMFEITTEEYLRCQNGTLKSGQGKHPKYAPFAFTELGVAMLSSVLKSETAIEVNRGIMRAFVAARKVFYSNMEAVERISRLESSFSELKEDLEEIFSDYNDINEDTRMQIELINNTLAELQAGKMKENRRNKVGFKTGD